MRMLILGGTAWLGRHVADTALAAGHRVTCLARGTTGAPPDGATWVQADRDLDDAYAPVRAGPWDAVVDVSRQPGQVRRAAQALAGTCGTYVFVSSISVYADTSRPGQDETAALLPALQADVMADMSQYGAAKVACERHVLDAVGADRALIVRAGLIGGPGDTSDRTGYWPWRFARAAALARPVLLPDTPNAATRLIDVRDLAQWMLRCAEQRTAGAFNAAGERVTFRQFIDAARRAAGSHCPTVAASSAWLLEQGVAPWAGPRSLPLWVPMATHAGFSTHDCSRAIAAGLVRRPLDDTLCDTLAWELQRQPAPAPRRAGLLDTDEAALLAALAGGDDRPPAT
jgi:nucleoside-diphosphate-sugar epimerase